MVADDQSGDIKSSDLQVAMTSSSAFAMTHRMSLAKITLKYKAGVVTTKNYTWNTSSGTASIQNNGTTNVMASKSFSTTSSYVKPYYHTTESNQEIYYYVAKYNEKPQLIDNDATEYKKWTSAITIQNASSQALGKGNYAAFTATSRAENRAWCYYVGTFSYANSAQTFTTPIAGSYQIECWGASGGTAGVDTWNGNQYARGCAGYVSGDINLDKNQTLFVYTGQEGYDANQYTSLAYMFNGGGYTQKKPNQSTNKCGPCGGGATDVRTVSGNWDNSSSLNSRIIIAAGGGGGSSPSVTEDRAKLMNSCAGGLNGYNGISAYADTRYDNYIGKGATQSAGGAGGTQYQPSALAGQAGSLGKGGYGGYSADGVGTGGGGGGGGGLYGGGGSSGLSNGIWGAGGGSSYISGHSGCTAKSLTFTNTVMIDGAGYNWTNQKGSYVGVPDITNTSTRTVGYIGNGYARITFVSE